MGLLLILAALLAACGGANTSNGNGAVTPGPSPAPASTPDDADSLPEAAAEPTQIATALAPATAIPDDLDLELELSPDAEPIDFNYTLTAVHSAEGAVFPLGMLVADTFERRTRGLMFRVGLPSRTGMLFAFPVPTTGSFWAKDTPLDLDVAFLDETGVIQEILSLDAFSTERVAPETEYLFAVEMLAGWFAKRNIEVGSQFDIPPSVVGFAE